MKKITLLLSFIACVLVAQGQTLLVENFNYTVGDLLNQGSWGLTGTTSTPNIQVTAGSITYANYPGSGIGNEVTLDTKGQDLNKVFPTQTTGTIYVSALVNVTSAGTGDYFLHVGPDVIGSSFFGRTFVKSEGGKIAFGIQNASGGSATSQTYTAADYELNTTYLLVLKVDVTTGASSLIVNPSMTSEPSTGWVSNNSGTTLPANIGSVALRQGSTTAGVSAALKIDGIRVATSYVALFSNTNNISNPTSANLEVSLKGKMLSVTNTAAISVEIFSALGTKVETVQLVNGSADLSHFSKGLYIVRVGKQSAKIML